MRINKLNKNLRLGKEIKGKTLKYYEFLCLIYVTLILAGNTIVARLFPFHVPFMHWVIPFGGGILFFPLLFTIQDITTEVYGYGRSRRMVWLSVVMILIYVGYTQIAIHLPSGTDHIYDNNKDFTVVFNAMPRHVFALIVSLFTGSLINDFLMSKSKILLRGRYLWLRSIGATMIGEIVLQIVGGFIGFMGTLKFGSQLLPNMFMAYLYKLLWDAATVPLVYFVSARLKKAEDIDVYDYDANYNPFVLNADG